MNQVQITESVPLVSVLNLRDKSPRVTDSNSSRGSHAPPRGTREPLTGQSGKGGLNINNCEVREMRNATTVLNTIRLPCRNSSLESYVIRKAVMSSLKGAVGKVPIEATRWSPTLPHVWI